MNRNKGNKEAVFETPEQGIVEGTLPIVDDLCLVARRTVSIRVHTARSREAIDHDQYKVAPYEPDM